MSTPILTNEALAKVLSAAITAAGLHEGDVAQAAGIPLADLRVRLTGAGAPFLLTEVSAIAATVGLPASELIARAEGTM